MSSALISTVVCFIITFPGASAEDKGLPESTIIAIACLASFVTIVIVLSTVCYCYRKVQVKAFKKRQRKLKEISSIIQEHYSENAYNSKQNNHTAYTKHIINNQAVSNHTLNNQTVSNHIGNNQTVENDASTNQIVTNHSQSNQIFSNNIAVNHTGTVTQNEKEAELSRHQTTFSDVTDTQQSDMVVNGHYQTTYGGSAPAKIQKYADWRRSQSTQQIYTGRPAVSQENMQYVLRTRPAHSVAVSRSPHGSPGFERGRSSKRFVYTLPRNAVDVRTIRMKQRSRSAPPHGRRTVVTQQPITYTKSHYLAIKQPFGKKYLLPPTQMYQMERPVQKRMVTVRQPQVQVPVQHPPPQPVQHVHEGNVFHIKYEQGSRNTIHRQTSGDDVFYEEPYNQSYGRANQSTAVLNTSNVHNKYPIHLANYKPKIIHANQYDVVNGGTSNQWTSKLYESERKSGVWSSDDTYVNTHTFGDENTYTGNGIRTNTYQTKIITASTSGVAKSEPTDENYTIIDYVEPVDSSRTIEHQPLSTSTPRFHDTAIQDLDNVLNNGASSSSSSPSSSSSSNSGSKHN